MTIGITQRAKLNLEQTFLQTTQPLDSRRMSDRDRSAPLLSQVLNDSAIHFVAARSQHWASRYGLSLGDAEDIAQTALVRFVSQWQTLTPDERKGFWDAKAFQGWITRAMRFVSLETIRRRARMSQLGDKLAESLVSTLSDLTAITENKEAEARLRQAVGKLDPETRRIFECLLLGWTSQQIAEEVGMSPAAVRKRLQRLRETLRAAMT